MKVLILMGSPRVHGNTAELCKPFRDELERGGVEVVYLALAEKHVLPCKACYACQNVQGDYGCVQKDDMEEVAKEILSADCIVFATPIYAWYCPTTMKSVMDRHYGFNKYYGSANGCLWEGKKVAILATHGYDAAYATEPFETGIKRLCEHSHLEYIGMYSVRDTDDLASFQTAEAVTGAKQFAKEIILRLEK